MSRARMHVRQCQRARVPAGFLRVIIALFSQPYRAIAIPLNTVH